MNDRRLIEQAHMAGFYDEGLGVPWQGFQARDRRSRERKRVEITTPLRMLQSTSAHLTRRPMTNDEQLTVDLWLLDAILTGKDSRSGRGDENQIVSLDEFALGRLFYLSDGGYSRVYHAMEDRELFLSSESRREVRARWDCDAAQTIKRRIQRLVGKWIKEQSTREDANDQR